MITSPLFITTDSSFSVAQSTTPTFSGELLPDPHFAEEPYVEIGQFSPEFDYEYSPGSLALIWTHSSGYELDYGDYYSASCYEYARVSQTFRTDYNESVKSVKIATSIRVDTTGDFAATHFPDNMWEINIGIYNSYGGFAPLRTVSDFEISEETELEFMLTEMETDTIFQGPEIMREYGLYVQLTPTYYFGLTLGDSAPWMDYSGSVRATITHMSFEVMLEGESQAPPLRKPMYNMTLLQNETTSVITGIESSGYDQLIELRQNQNPEISYTLFTRSSNHNELRNHTILFSESDFALYGLISFAIQDDHIAALSVKVEGDNYSIRVKCIDSLGNSTWNSTISLFYEDFPVMADFDRAGNLWIYMISLDAPQDPFNPYEMSLIHSLVKLDSQGTKLWNKTLRRVSYSVYTAALNLGLPTGFGVEGNTVIVGFNDEIIKIDSNSEEVWNREYNHDALCVDPQGGCYTYSMVHQSHTELRRWGTSGNVVWTKSLGWDYGNGWTEEPAICAMTVGPNGPLHLVLAYQSIDSSMVLMRVTRAGDILSQDTIFEKHEYFNEYYLYIGYLPVISDIAVTGDGLVHLTGTGVYYPYITSPLYAIPGTFLITYQLPEILTFTPISIGMIGVASVLIIGIAYDFFFRRRNIPEPPPEPSITDFEW